METNFSLQSFLVEQYKNNQKTIKEGDSSKLAQMRDKAFEAFAENGFPDKSMDNWRSTDLTKALSHDYKILLQAPPYNPVDSYFKCNIKDFDTFMFTFLNGWYVHKNVPLTVFPDGIIVGSLAHAKKEYPEIVDKYLGTIAKDNNNPMLNLNGAFMQDGAFVYVPEGVQISKPLQIVNIVNTKEDLLIQNRNLIIVEKNAALKLVHCDDSVTTTDTFINSVSEIYVGQNAEVSYYKLENKDSQSLLINSLYVKQENDSRFLSNGITFNSGVTRNTITVNIDGSNCDADVNGLYLVDKQQKVDNYVRINHNKPHSRSSQLYKGIMDDQASGSFTGYVYVEKDAQKTEAYQTNNNIALTDEASVGANPFLEIYADDVKCSHGATIGQLDNEALFYMRQRGICERNSRMLLMYAFAMEVVNKIDIEALHKQTDDMVSRRLRGELSICDMCELHCGDHTELHFEIDMLKI
ncbi:MAG: Fe-S cluster assembly protein SufD [Bacteroidales bacterium]